MKILLILLSLSLVVTLGWVSSTRITQQQSVTINPTVLPTDLDAETRASLAEAGQRVESEVAQGHILKLSE